MLKFESFSSKFDPRFWSEFADIKINKIKLDSEPIDLRAFYSAASHSEPSFPCLLEFSGDHSFTLQHEVSPKYCSYYGKLYNFNTIEDFDAFDVKKVMAEMVDNIWKSILDGRAIKDCKLLFKFALLTFADLKKFKFTYWMCVPAIILPSQIIIERSTPITKCFTDGQIEVLGQYAKNNPVFILDSNHVEIKLFNTLETWRPDMFLCIVDPSNKREVVGWPFRNVLALMRHAFPENESINVISIRDLRAEGGIKSSVIFHLKLSGSVLHDGCDIPKAVGFERNLNGKLAPSFVDLGAQMDPKRMAESVADLNLKLMRWRLVPELNLDIVSSKKCLLLGAGTLGCYLARCLLGWGVRDITFVDNGQVSYSNMTRQPLYEYQDFGKPKAKIAAENIARIFPGINSVGEEMNILMPGHLTDTREKLLAEYEKLVDLIKKHDVLFLLMDSRESRWLPTVLGKVFDKIVINIALGFDSYLVMRHGSSEGPHRLGCYFCNDVVAPTDSLSNRTLDQQCTVTRPGLAAMASSLGCELFVSLLQHPLLHHAPAFDKSHDSEDTKTCLGVIPHQIRGFLYDFSNMIVTGAEYKNCTACSKKICGLVRSKGFEFIYSVLSDPKILEKLSGLQEMAAAAIEADIEWDDEDE